MEAVTIARQNWLEENHVIGRLLKPHTKNTIFINFAARNTLVAEEDSGVQSMFSVGRDGAMQLISEEMSQHYSWPKESFPTMMEARGFPQNKSDGLKDFHYRDDGFKLWDALHRYVEGVVQVAYPSEQAIEEDEKLAGFHASLANTEEGNIPGFPQNAGDREQLVDTLTSIIFTGSVQHQALNAPHHVYSYMPHRPTILTKWMPEEGEEDISWPWIKEALPSIPLTKDIFELSMILATHSQCNLASLDVFEDDIPQVHKRLQNDLATISSLVKGRGGDYDYLDPENVACSIDI